MRVRRLPRTTWGPSIKEESSLAIGRVTLGLTGNLKTSRSRSTKYTTWRLICAQVIAVATTANTRTDMNLDLRQPSPSRRL